jgi:polar amino acid transport system substrate-binding protein
MSAGRLLAVAALAWITAACATVPAAPSAEARAALAPTGTLRVAGIAIDLGRALAERLGAAFVPVVYPNAGALVAGARAGGLDVGFAAVDPARADVLEFTAPYMEVSVTYLVPARSDPHGADADGRGLRIAVGTGNAADLFLSRATRHARVMRIPDTRAAAASAGAAG